MSKKKNVIKPLNKEHLDEIFDADLTIGEKIADGAADFVGSWTFILLFSGFLLLWVGLNFFGVVLHLPMVWDGPPFILLNLILSFIAAYQAPMIMMSQNRTDERDRARDQLQFDITNEARTELFEIHEQVDLLREEIRLLRKELQSKDDNL